MRVKQENLLFLLSVIFGLSACAIEAEQAVISTQEGSIVSSPLALVGGTLIDGSEIAPLLANSVILIRDGRIERVGTVADTSIPAEYEQISTEGMTVMPGLWDMHVHLLYAGHTNIPYWHETYTPRFEEEIMPATATQQLWSGVTSVRDLGAPADAVFNLRNRIASGDIPGPTIYAAGPQINRNFPDWARFYRTPVSNPQQAAAVANALIDSGADMLKISGAENMSVEDIRAITDAAHARGIMVTAHGRNDQEILMGLQGGVDEFQHIGVSAESPEYSSEIMAAIRDRVIFGPPLYWTPTVSVQLARSYLEENPEILDAQENYAGLPEDIAMDIREAVANFSPTAVDADIVIRKVTQLREAGVELLVGTDAGLVGNFHSQAMWQEMDSWVNILGIEPLETIRRATSLPARLMGREGEVGRVVPGQRADIIVVEGDPLRHMDVLRSPAIVILRGQRIR